MQRRRKVCSTIKIGRFDINARYVPAVSLSQQLKVCDRILTHADPRRTCNLHTERLQSNGGIKPFILLFFIKKVPFIKNVL